MMFEKDFFSELRLDQVVQYWSELKPKSIALQFKRTPSKCEVLTWLELNILIDQQVERFRAYGIGYEDTVAIVLEDDPQVHVSIYALFRIGVTVVPIDPLWGVDVIKSIEKTVRAKVLICIMEERISQFSDVSKAVLLSSINERDSAIQPTTCARGTAQIDNVALIAFTSGTTSAPKGVPLTHRNLRAAYQNGVRYLPNLESKSNFGCVFRLSGLGVLGVHYFLANEVGACTTVLPLLDVRSCRQFWSVLENEKIDFVYLVPTLVKLLNHYSIPNQDPITNLLCVTSGGPIPEDTFSFFQTRFGQMLLNIYGLTELSFAVFFGDAVSVDKGSISIGKALGVEAKLLNAKGEIIEEPDTIGELYIKGPMLAKCYLNNKHETEQSFFQGWLKTGDLAKYDRDGNYFITGRIKNIVIRGGFNISLEEIEEVTTKHPLVIDACAIGVPDSISGEEIILLVHKVTNSDLSEITIKKWIVENAGRYKSPRKVYFIDHELPRNGAGKLQRQEAEKIVDAILARSYV